MTKPSGRPGEDELIVRYFAPIAGEGALGLKDDAALVRPRPGHDLVVTADAVVAGVHFFADDPPASVAVKALGVNVSDLAAKGAAPSGFVLTLTLPQDWTEAWLSAFCEGLGEAARAFACPLLGGDTVRGPTLALSITAFGEVAAGRMVRRTTATPGDRICVSGTIGDAALGLALRTVIPGEPKRSEGEERGSRTPALLGPPSRAAPPPAGDDSGLRRREQHWAAALSKRDREFLVDRYLRPRPRLALAPALLGHASAAMDVSDGLAGDLAKMMRASGATATVEGESIPLSPAGRAALAADPALFDRLVTGGDDYEILAAVPPGRLESFLEEAREAGVATTAIGTVTDGQGLPAFRVGSAERRYERGSYSHFRDEA